MGLSDTLSSIASNVLTRKVGKPSSFGPDFPGGLIITEVVDGKEIKATQIVLLGNFLPNEKIKHGVTQKVNKEYYPGNPEPSIQVLGARDDDLPLKGTFKLKHLKDETLRGAAVEYQRALDAIVRRGNLVKVVLGELRWYGILESGKFEFMRLQEIGYELSLSVISRNLPSNCKQLGGTDTDLAKPNQELINALAAALAKYQNYPSTMPRTLGEFLNDQISVVAGAINSVTKFIDNIIQTASDVEASAARAVGLIKNARTKITIYQRRLGALSLSRAILGTGGSRPGQSTVYHYNNADHIIGSLQAMTSISAQLAALQAKYAALAATLPLRRYLVKDGDTLQGLSAKFYGTSESWTKIYDHNKLTSTTITRGTILEIPR